MKNTTRIMIIFSAIFVTSTAFISCNKNRDCRYDNMTYNKHN